MAGKVNVYGLGEHGINRVKSPVHVIDGELLSSQNATTYPVGAQLGLKKRDGMAKINSSAAAGTLLAIHNIPLANPAGLGTAWSSPPATGLTLALRSVAWSPDLGMFVAVGDAAASGNAMRSTDGINWTAMTIGSATRNWRNIIWVDVEARFVAAGQPESNAGYVGYSTDGINWTIPSPLPFNGNIEQVTYSPDLDQYILLPANGTTTRNYYSSDAISWTNSDLLPIATQWVDCAWSPTLGIYCAIENGGGGAQQVITSPDGLNWTLRTTGNSAVWETIHWSEENQLFSALASTLAGGTKKAMTSPDGITWTVRDPANTNNWQAICETDTGRLVAVASSGAAGDQVMASLDGGLTWSISSPAVAARSWRDVVYSPELEIFVAVAFNGDPMYSP